MRLQADNPMARVLLMVLTFEVIVFGLAVPVMIMVSHTPLALAFGAGAGAALLALAAAATLRTPAGYPLGWLAQVAGLALGLLTYGMLVMGVIFAALWVVCFVLGKRLESQGRSASNS